jgi:hypothetical protein
VKLTNLAFLAKLAYPANLGNQIKLDNLVNLANLPYLPYVANWLNIFWISVQLVGGEQGNLHAKNPKTGIFGPVCDDTWNMKAVSTLFGTAYILLL